MLFPTVNFAIFFVIVLAISWLLRPRDLLWRLFIIGASWFFYGWWDERFVLLLGASTLFNFAMAWAVHRSMSVEASPAEGDQLALFPERAAGISAGPTAEPGETPRRYRTSATRLVLAAGIAGNLGVLGWFKYYEFFSTSLQNALSDIGLGTPLPLLEITLPIGISFFTFQAISYLVDISRGDIEPMKPLDFATYLSFFPHLVAGPIVRATEFAPQLEAPPKPASIPLTAAASLILVGLFKKVVISSYLGSEIVDPVFALPQDHSSFEIIIATYAYAIQIFADFSGYTDIAIGCALLLGFQFPQNFDSPYRALTLQEFWRRWHMTLSRWLRDYLYIPLGGNRGPAWFVARNLMITMVLGGLWHGAAWTFIAWGAIHGAGLMVERLVRGREAPQSTAWTVVRWLITFHVVCLAWVFFRAESTGLALEMLGRMFTAWGAAPLVTPLLLLVIAGMLAAQFVPRDFLEGVVIRVSEVAPLAQAAAFAMAIVMIDALGPEGVSPFIYFRF